MVFYMRNYLCIVTNTHKANIPHAVSGISKEGVQTCMIIAEHSTVYLRVK